MHLGINKPCAQPGQPCWGAPTTTGYGVAPRSGAKVSCPTPPWNSNPVLGRQQGTRRMGERQTAYSDCQRERRKPFTLTSGPNTRCCYQEGNADGSEACERMLIIREMQIKTALKQCLSPVRLAKLKKGLITQQLVRKGSERPSHARHWDRVFMEGNAAMTSALVMPPPGTYPANSSHMCEMEGVPYIFFLINY